MSSEIKINNKSQDKSSKKIIVKNATKTRINHTYVGPNSYVLLNASVTTNKNMKINEGKVYFKLNGLTIKNPQNKKLTASKEWFCSTKMFHGSYIAS